MKKSLLVMALGLCTVLNSAYAETYDATLSGDGYQFSNSFSGTTAFDDYIFFSTEGMQNIVASVSGTGSEAFSFDVFNLVDEDKNLVATGSVFNSSAHIAFGALETSQYGNFYLHVVGNTMGGTAGYNGTITNFVAAVPEPETYALMLSGLGLIGLITRRKMRDNA